MYMNYFKTSNRSGSASPDTEEENSSGLIVDIPRIILVNELDMEIYFYDHESFLVV